MGFVYTSFAFNEARNKAGRISLLMLPCNTFEKYLARFIVYVPLYLVVFGVAMFVADAVRVASLSIFYYQYIDKIHFLSIDSASWDNVEIVLAVFVGMQSFYWLGAILWPRNSLIKTFAALSVLGTLYSIVTPLLYFVILDGERICSVPLLDGMNPKVILWITSGIVCVVNYTLAYMRLKETDVIQRLL